MNNLSDLNNSIIVLIKLHMYLVNIAVNQEENARIMLGDLMSLSLQTSSSKQCLILCLFKTKDLIQL